MQKQTQHLGRVALSALLAVFLAGSAATGASAMGPGGWDHLGSKLNGAVYVLNADAGDGLDLGGSFYDAAGKPDADYMARWYPSGFWTAFGPPPLTGPVHALAYGGSSRGTFYAGGVFTNAGGDANADHLAVWDSVARTWTSPCTSATGGPAFTGNVEALEIVGQTLFVGGTFQNGAGIASADYLVACDLDTGAARSIVPGTEGIGGPVYTMDSDSAGNLYVGGGFFNVADNPAADNVAYMDPAGVWHAMGTSGVNNDDGSTDFVRALTVGDNDDVYVSTDGLDVAGIAQADHVARWDGSTWSALGSNTAGDDGWFSTLTYIYGMTSVGSLVFVTGSFQNANGNPLADNIAYYDGSDWSNVGSDGAGNGPWIGTGHALATFNGKLFAGGNFTSAGGDPMASGVAAFDLVSVRGRIGTARRESAPGSSTLGQGASKTISVRRGRTGTFFVNFENNGLSTRSFDLTGTGSERGYTVKYFNGAQDVTTAVRNGTFRAEIAPGAHQTLKMTVKLSKRAARKGTFVTKAQTSGASATTKAIVKAK